MLLIEHYVDTVINANLDERMMLYLFLDRDLAHKHSNQFKIRMSIAGIFDGPIEEGVQVLQPFLKGLAEFVDPDEACARYSSLCTSPEGIQKAKEETKKWMINAGPLRANHTFVSWAKQFGGRYVATYWTSGMIDEWTHDVSKVLINSLKSSHALMDVHHDLCRYPGIEHVQEGIYGELALTIEHIGGAMGHSTSLWKHRNAKALVAIEGIIRKTRPYQHPPPVFMDAFKRWTESTYTALKAYTTGSYASYAYPEMKDWENLYYGQEAYKMLIDIKSRIPGTEIFDGPQRIRTPEMSPDNRSTEMPGLKRSSLKSNRSDLCPDWLLKAAIPETSMQDPTGQLRNATLKEDVRIDDVQGKTVVLTGGSRGIGYAAVLHLLQLGAVVYATAQSTGSCNQTVSKIEAVLPSASTRFHCFDVSLDDALSVEDFVSNLSDHLKTTHSKIDVLILNAAHNGSAGWATDMVYISKCVAVNHLGQFYLTLQLIQERLLDVHSGRVVIQSSGLAFRVKEADLIDLAIQREGDGDGSDGQVRVDNATKKSVPQIAGLKTYSATKAMNVAFALELARRLRSSKTYEDVRVFLSIPPVTVKTELSIPYIFNPDLPLKKSITLSSAAEGALSCVYAAAAHLDFLDYPPLTRFVAEEDFAHSTKAELLGIERQERKLQWEYQKRPAIANYVIGCQVGAVAARFRNLNWMRTNTTCNLWNWSVEILNKASGGQLSVKPDQSPLGDLYVSNCQLLN